MTPLVMWQQSREHHVDKWISILILRIWWKISPQFCYLKHIQRVHSLNVLINKIVTICMLELRHNVVRMAGKNSLMWMESTRRYTVIHIPHTCCIIVLCNMGHMNAFSNHHNLTYLKSGKETCNFFSAWFLEMNATAAPAWPCEERTTKISLLLKIRYTCC